MFVYYHMFACSVFLYKCYVHSLIETPNFFYYCSLFVEGFFFFFLNRVFLDNYRRTYQKEKNVFHLICNTA